MSRLALLIPARNARAHLGRLLDSVSSQSSAFDEVWLFDDASDDGTADVARAWGAHVIGSQDCLGPSAGKNALARATSCEWVHFHDADEALAPKFVERARNWMAQPDVDAILFATVDRDDASGRHVGGSTWDDAALRRDPVAYAVRHTITNCGVYRRERFLEAGGFSVDEAVKYNEDQAMHVRMALGGLRFRADDYVGVIVYRRDGSMSSGHPVECARSQVEVLKRVVDETGTRYRTEVGARAWRLAGVCAGYSDWPYVRESLDVARRVGYRIPSEEHWLVQWIGAVAPRTAVYGREWFIRTFKSQLRKGLPVATAMSGVGPAAQVPRQ